MIHFIIMVVLGCHLHDIQTDRIYKAIEYSNKINKPYIWFLTGGIKYNLQSYQDNYNSEAKIMLSILNKTDNIILDEKAKNTAENFNNLKKWIQYNNITNTDIVITTSDFHRERAEKIFNSIFQNKIIPKWNLSNKICKSCWYDEKIHMLNIENDIKKVKLF
jgi:uncharacterized SAM-binding protein YcdF (DUF218 family)